MCLQLQPTRCGSTCAIQIALEQIILSLLAPACLRHLSASSTAVIIVPGGRPPKGRACLTAAGRDYADPPTLRLGGGGGGLAHPRARAAWPPGPDWQAAAAVAQGARLWDLDSSNQSARCLFSRESCDNRRPLKTHKIAIHPSPFRSKKSLTNPNHRP